MPILIKGMAMPKNCAYCPCEHYECALMGDEHNGVDVTAYFEGDKRHPDCPLIEVPPHGRLIDADAYKQLLYSLGNRDYRREKGSIQDAIKFLHPHYAPTIIEAEDKDD